MKDFYKVCRGQVWWLMDTMKGDFEGTSLQRKDRPWLVVSCKENNQNASTYNCVPLTTSGPDHGIVTGKL